MSRRVQATNLVTPACEGSVYTGSSPNHATRKMHLGSDAYRVGVRKNVVESRFLDRIASIYIYVNVASKT